MYFLVESKRATATKDSWLVVPSISQCCAKHTSRFMGIWHTSLALIEEMSHKRGQFTMVQKRGCPAVEPNLVKSSAK